MRDTPNTLTRDELIATAKATGMWLHTWYQDLWFTPEELLQANAEGHFRWDAKNFELRHPDEREHQLKQEVLTAERILHNFRKQRGR